jgi:epoxyqueuosine reductase
MGNASGGPAGAAARVRARALELGFDAVGIAALAPLEAAARYEAWLAAGRHGGMTWLASDRHRARRADPERLLPGLRSVVCVALCHAPDADPGRDVRLGRVARYAAGEDYHRLMSARLDRLEDFIEAALPGSRALGYSDTGAILERGWAERAGLGWIARNTCLVSPRIGSWFVLGEVLVDRELEPDPPFARDHCGTCRRCLDACPTGALVAPHQLDARLCISYLTIELRGAIPRELRPRIGGWVFGCDVCQEVCPWNRFAPAAREARLHARGLEGWSLERFLGMDDATFEAVFAGSPIRRARRAGFLRNVCVALGNRGDAGGVPALERALAGEGAALVRGHAAWALGRIASTPACPAQAAEHARAALRRALDGDADAWVRDEATAALSGTARDAG